MPPKSAEVITPITEWKPTYEAMRIAFNTAINNDLIINHLEMNKKGNTELLGIGNNPNVSEEDRAEAAYVLEARKLRIQLNSPDEKFPGDKRFNPNSLSDDEVLYLLINLKLRDHPSSAQIEQFAKVRQIEIPNEDQRRPIPSDLLAKITYHQQ